MKQNQVQCSRNMAVANGIIIIMKIIILEQSSFCKLTCTMNYTAPIIIPLPVGSNNSCHIHI